MENIKNIAPLVSSIYVAPTQIPMNKAAGGAPLFQPMKMIEDLGKQYPCEKSKVKKRFAIFECPNCGKPFRASFYAIEHGIIKSCRCVIVKAFIERNTKHGLITHPLYSVYLAMKERCYNENNKGYKNYGGRGIIICNEWKDDFVCFYTWALSHGYKKGLIIDREDNDKEYSPENCRWTNRFISGQNTRVINKRNTSSYRGINYIKTGKRLKRWEASIMSKRKKYHLGYFRTPQQAAQAYNNFVITNGTAHPLNII